MKSTARKITPEEYILSVLTPDQRLEAAFKIAREAFKKTTLIPKDLEKAVKTIRRQQYAAKK